MRGRSKLLLAIFCLLPLSAAAATTGDPLTDLLFEDPSIQTDGFLLALNGRTIVETYTHGYTAESRHPTWSVSKTVLSSLVGIAVREGKISLKDSVCRFYPEFAKRPEICAIQVTHLLGWESGLRWDEGYDGMDAAKSSVLQMLYGDGHRDMAHYVLSLGVTVPPGVMWHYSTGDTLVLAGILSRVYGNADFAWTKLFDPLGMKSVTWERDGTGVLVGSSGLFATARDLVRYGVMLAQNGVWNGERILPGEWLDASARFPTAFAGDNQWVPSEERSGFHIWINRPHPLDPARRKLVPAAPDDLVSAKGHWGQSLVVIPSLGVVAVRLADDRHGKLDFARYVELLLKRVRR